MDIFEFIPAILNALAWPMAVVLITIIFRSRHVVEEALGDEFEGVLVSDFYGAYNVYQGPHQRCWTHLLRDIHQLKERFPEHDGLAQWSRRVREVYDQAQAYSSPDPGLPETVRRSRRVKQSTVH